MIQPLNSCAGDKGSEQPTLEIFGWALAERGDGCVTLGEIMLENRDPPLVLAEDSDLLNGGDELPLQFEPLAAQATQKLLLACCGCSGDLCGWSRPRRQRTSDGGLSRRRRPGTLVAAGLSGGGRPSHRGPLALGGRPSHRGPLALGGRPSRRGPLALGGRPSRRGPLGGSRSPLAGARLVRSPECLLPLWTLAGTADLRRCGDLPGGFWPVPPRGGRSLLLRALTPGRCSPLLPCARLRGRLLSGGAHR